MKVQEQNRTARIEARIAPEALAVVRRAAEIQGRSISDFVVAAAQDAARKAVAELEVIRLSREAQEQFISLLMNPPPVANATDPFSISLAAAPTVFADGTATLRVGIQGRLATPFEKKPTNLVFLVDVSGSMAAPEKLPPRR